jgi:cation diffusion facilitator family transporter
MRSTQEQRQAQRSTWLSVGLNVLLCVTQVLVGWFAASQALVADGLHSLSDLVADLVVLVAARQAHAQADEEHPYGHARFETAASWIIGLILLGTGLGMIVSAGLRLHDGSSLGAVHPVALATALLTLVVKEILFRSMRRVAERLKSAMLLANAWHARADAASSLVVAAGIAANLLGWHSMDGVAAVLVGGMIVKAGWSFSVEAFHSLTDHALEPEEIARIRLTVEAVDGVQGLHKLRTRRMGDWAVIDLHVEVDARLSVSEGHYIAEQINAQVQAAHRVAECTVHVDPGVVRHVAHILALPTRERVQDCVQAVMAAWKPGDAASAAVSVAGGWQLELHYLENGLGVVLELSRVIAPQDSVKLQALLLPALQQLTAQPVRLQLKGRL